MKKLRASLGGVSLRWQIAVPAIVTVSMGIVITIAVTTWKTKATIIGEAKNVTLTGYRDIVLNALTTMMLAGGDIKSAKKSFLEQMEKVGDVRVIRGEAVNKDYGTGDETDSQKDSIENSVIATGKEYVEVVGEFLRGVYPYIAKSDFMGKNCLNCHNVSEGTVLGAVSIKIPLHESFSIIKRTAYLYLCLGILGIMNIAGMLMVIISGPLRSVRGLKDSIGRIASGDLRHGVAFNGSQEVATLSDGVDSMRKSFEVMVNGIIDAGLGTVTHVDIVRSKAEKTAMDAKEQTSRAHQIATAATEMSQTITDIAANASNAAKTADLTIEIAEAGREVAEGTADAMKKAYQSAESLSVEIGSLAEQANAIMGITAVIKDIAEQTNLLALNAAIEAARAGERGRGFAVVADEVRKLAERTATATKDIEVKTKTIQARVLAVVVSMKVTTGSVQSAAQQIDGVMNSFASITDGARSAGSGIASIAAAVEEQSRAAEEISNNIEKTAAIASEIESLTNDVLHESNNLIETAEKLRDSTAQFKTPRSELIILDVTKGDHRTFVGKIRAHIDGDKQLDPSKLADHRACRLGKWYYGEGRALCSGLPAYSELEHPHQRVHQIGKEVLMAFARGDKAKAEQLFQEMEVVSSNVINCLDKLKAEAHIGNGDSLPRGRGRN